MTLWIERMEFVFHISSYAQDCRVKFATCMFMDALITLCNDHSKTMGINASYSLRWYELKQMIIEKYCPKDEMQKLEQEL